ncbi:ABC-2 type transporter [Gordonia bronchialis DSM 43247]|uniref:Transport permease protein n=1 Tax=Gordonia bronchialis (strain ATCC 25592 / DSM 43247 / BCRC 13721 / JCM 3198 / KCTC 3076 / NBRC 16047 / NCTC 10667) TaxID=526226 RepID=D0L7N0_GORB4|nr:ABC transporter permease [Gordonia bronchialis]ACY20893.1 ABC-2 type transporter [Gordonia bronchialis DSM 43247]MCC3323668.1 ABC transporter permease [Gordonia bronchialis]QGS25374.1 ABC transporter permease [Gordonia bronchialis]STQ63737.1 Daunorubicin/doxorubicin resistance ABC transporter permease protein drrB [Gordonia bronchialis]
MTTTIERAEKSRAITTREARGEAKTSVSFAETVRQSLSMAYRGVLKIRHNPEQLFDVTIQPIIFTLMFTYIFGGAISGNVHDYLPVIIPGILVQTVIMTSIVTGTQLREDMDKGVFDRFRSLPIARISPLAGALLADVIRYLVATTLTIVMGVIMGWRPEFWGVIASALLVMICSFAVSWIFALMGCLMNKASAVQGISMLIMFPLTFMSNAFVPVETMPGWLQAFVNINPVSHLVTAVRELTNSGHVGIHVVWALLGAAIITVVFAPLAVKAYMRNT